MSENNENNTIDNSDELENDNEINESPDTTLSASAAKRAEKRRLKNNYAKMRIARKQKWKIARKQQVQGIVEKTDDVINEIALDENSIDDKIKIPVEKENPFKRDIVEPRQNQANSNFTMFQNEDIGVDIVKELNNSNMIIETDEDEELEDDDIDKADKVDKADTVDELEENLLDINVSTENINVIDVPDENESDDIAVEDVETTQKEIAADAISFEDIAVGGENDPTVNTDQVSMSDKIHILRFYERLEQRMNNQTVTRQVKDQLSDIIGAAGITDPSKIAETVDSAYEYGVDAMRSMYMPDGVKFGIVDVIEYAFEESCQSIAYTNLSTKDQFITAQKIADVILKNYSPVTFTDGELDRYAESYVLNSRTLLRKQLEKQKIPENKIEPLMQEIKAALALDSEKEQAKPELKENVKTENAPVKEKPSPKLTEEQMRHLFGADPKSKEEEKKTTQPQAKDSKPQEPTPRNTEAGIAVYMEKLKAYNSMYKLDIDGNNFASSVTEAWALMTSGDQKKRADGQKVMNNLFKDTLKRAFDIEKGVAYDEHRLPEYAEIIRSSNELLRSSMFAFTDLYHDPAKASLFESTAFGGLNAKDMASLTSGKSSWDMDQKSDAAWEIQAAGAKDLADSWLSEDRPYEKMINELNVLANKARDDASYDRKAALMKLTAAEWLLVNNSKMMVEDPQDPLNPIPNWGNRYWKALTETREALGIDKHTSMRELIQGDYASAAKAVCSVKYNEAQIKEHILDPEVREVYDSMDVQKEQFATLCAAVVLTDPKTKNEKTPDELETSSVRVQISVSSEDERMKMKNEPKVFKNLVVENSVSLQIDRTGMKP